MTTAAHRWSHPPYPGGGGWGYDFNTEYNWLLMTEAVQESLQKARASPDDILGIAGAAKRC